MKYCSSLLVCVALLFNAVDGYAKEPRYFIDAHSQISADVNIATNIKLMKKRQCKKNLAKFPILFALI